MSRGHLTKLGDPIVFVGVLVIASGGFSLFLIHTHTHTQTRERERERQTDRQTDRQRQRDRQRQTETNIQTGKQKSRERKPHTGRATTKPTGSRKRWKRVKNRQCTWPDRWSTPPQNTDPVSPQLKAPLYILTEACWHITTVPVYFCSHTALVRARG